MQKEKLEFPPGFLWGAATSSHQVEGSNFNNWSEWEKKNAQRLANQSEEKFGHLNNWLAIENQARDPKNYISGQACDHYNLYEKDFDLAKELNHSAHRFSLEWSRIEPEQGYFDEKEIEHYKKVILALRQRKIEPIVTLWHWTSPLWFFQKGGWLNKEAPQYFENYTKEVVKHFGNMVNIWVTINEPLIFLKHFLQQDSPPRNYNLFSILKTINRLALAHKKAYEVIHQNSGKNKVGITKHCIFFEGGLKASISNYYWNHYFLNKIKDTQDFIGLNYYHHHKFSGNENKEVSDLGWEIYAQGIYDTLKDLERYKKPIYITENGLADAKDLKRTKFIIEHLKWIHRAISEGIDVRGYLHWSLLDNFEWDKGFWPHFGLVEINYKTLERKIRPSAYLYAEICKNNKLTLNQ